MTELNTTVTPLEYQAAASRPYSVNVARWVRRVATVPPVVGVAILLAFACTGWKPLTDLGLWWVVVGGLIAFCNAVLSLVMYVVVRPQNQNNAPARWEYGLALILGLASVPIAFICGLLGSLLMEWWLHRKY